MGINGVILKPPAQHFATGKLSFVIYRRDLVTSAPDSVFIHIVARVARERTIGLGGSKALKQVSNTWYLRSRGYEFRVAGYPDNKEMILIRAESPDFVLPDGRYAMTFGGQLYDFLVNKESEAAEHCVEWVVNFPGVDFHECPVASPPRAGYISIRDIHGESVEVKDFKNDPEAIKCTINRGYYNLGYHSGCLLNDIAGSKDPPYLIQYIDATQYFSITLQHEPLSATRQQAERYLLAHLGISPGQMCKLKFNVDVPRWVDRTYASRNLGFSFCPGAVPLPGKGKEAKPVGLSPTHHQ